MSILFRTITYATLFIGFVLVYLPARVLNWTGVTATLHGAGSLHGSSGLLKVLGLIVAGVGAAAALWCIATFVHTGKGTPAPFDPPRRLVTRGPYRFVRNPMYMGGATAMLGAALYYGSPALGVYAILFLLASHAFLVV